MQLPNNELIEVVGTTIAKCSAVTTVTSDYGAQTVNPKQSNCVDDGSQAHVYYGTTSSTEGRTVAKVFAK